MGFDVSEVFSVRGRQRSFPSLSILSTEGAVGVSKSVNLAT